MPNITKASLLLRHSLRQEEYNAIDTLQKLCEKQESIVLKLELDYKFGNGNNTVEVTETNAVNEFMYFDKEELIGYLGIGTFGGALAPFELTGMVHPAYRRQGVFTKLMELALNECRNRKAPCILLLCDKTSVSGQEYVRKTKAKYQYSEFEMYLHDKWQDNLQADSKDIHFQKAMNADAGEVARQNAIYFGSIEEENAIEGEWIWPEEEEKKGMTIYLAKKEEIVIGKVHLQQINGLGAIYGLGVLPEFRGNGYGRGILIRAIKQLLEENADKIMLQVAAENETALSLYLSCGFQETSVMDYYELMG
jgi:ribosomal protein S18 acetylase RimI-like enzyme